MCYVMYKLPQGTRPGSMYVRNVLWEFQCAHMVPVNHHRPMVVNKNQPNLVDSCYGEGIVTQAYLKTHGETRTTYYLNS